MHNSHVYINTFTYIYINPYKRKLPLKVRESEGERFALLDEQTSQLTQASRRKYVLMYVLSISTYVYAWLKHNTRRC